MSNFSRLVSVTLVAVAVLLTGCTSVPPQQNQQMSGQMQQGGTVSRAPQCIIGGVNYPEHASSDAACRAKESAIKADIYRRAQEAPRAAVKADDVKVDSTTGRPIANVCAWINPDTKERFDKPASHKGSCPSFVKEVAGRFGFSIATRQ